MNFEDEQKLFQETSQKFADAAFPLVVEMQYTTKSNTLYKSHTKGLSKREYMATQILAALSVPAIAGGHNTNNKQEISHKVEMAVNLTDALIKALEKT